MCKFIVGLCIHGLNQVADCVVLFIGQGTESVYEWTHAVQTCVVRVNLYSHFLVVRDIYSEIYFTVFINCLHKTVKQK